MGKCLLRPGATKEHRPQGLARLLLSPCGLGPTPNGGEHKPSNGKNPKSSPAPVPAKAASRRGVGRHCARLGGESGRLRGHRLDLQGPGNLDVSGLLIRGKRSRRNGGKDYVRPPWLAGCSGNEKSAGLAQQQPPAHRERLVHEGLGGSLYPPGFQEPLAEGDDAVNQRDRQQVEGSRYLENDLGRGMNEGRVPLPNIRRGNKRIERAGHERRGFTARCGALPSSNSP